MKRIFTLVAALIMTVNVWAQSPEKMSYQAVIRDASNSLLIAQTVGMQISILQGGTTGIAVYVETQTPSTNVNGLVSLEIGTGTSTDDFSTIDWSAGLYFIKTETDPTGGTTYTITGTSQLMSVPFALHAKTASSIVGGVSITETDPVFGASIANGITAADTTNWNKHTVDTKLDSTTIDSLGFITSFTEIDGSITNEIQDLQLVGNTLTITNNGTATIIDLSPYLDNTDTQLDSTGVAALGYVAGAHITDTHIDSTGIAALGFNPEFKRINGVVQNTTATATDDFVFGSTTLNNIPGGSDDNRMFFDKSKGAFRAGHAEGTEWDVSNLGGYSTAMGYNTKATGFYSTAMGYYTRASGYYSIAMGVFTQASGNNSTAMGKESVASGSYSTAMGYYTKATGPSSTSMGYLTKASGSYSTAMGRSSVASGANSIAMGSSTWASGLYSTAMGSLSVASGSYSTSMGRSSVAPSYCEVAVGMFNTTYTPTSTTLFDPYDRVFTVGNGSSDASREDAMVILKNGNVGIGTSTPNKAKLEINGSQSYTPLGVYGFLVYTGATGPTVGEGEYSIYASNRIAATQFNAFSDARIKNIKGVSNSQKDLVTLAQIEITNYQLTDTIAEGSKTIKKVIAQQVKDVFPQAVSTDLTRCVPTIYKLSELNDGWISLATNLVKGDKVKLIFTDTEELVEVVEVNTNSFRITTTKANGKVFVYGKEVSDFHTVDYEAISMLNVSATQELLKRIEQLELENSTLKVENANQNTRINRMEASLSEIKEFLGLKIIALK